MTDEQTTCGYCTERPAVTVAATSENSGGTAQLHHGPGGEVAAKPACGVCLAEGRHQYKQTHRPTPPGDGGGYIEGN